MKKIVISFLTLITFFSCNQSPKKQKFVIGVCQGDNINYTVTYIECDSFQMINSKEAFIWVSGTKMKVIGDRGIKPESR
jgi:hypothetical protein